MHHFCNVGNNIKIWVEEIGDKNNEAVLLISGAGANSSFWTDEFCNELIGNGFYVIRYDHRDFGYSTKIDYSRHPYEFMQLAEDVIFIMDSLYVNKTHIVGHSMGGFIAQLLVINYPERVISITSASSSTNSPKVPLPPEKTWKLFMENKPQNDFEKDLPGFMMIWNYLNGTATFEKGLAIEYTRNLYTRQKIIGALGESHVKAQSILTDRTEMLKSVDIPALVIHGEEDYLVDKYGGIQTAECLKNSKLVLVPEMGHMLFNRIIRSKFEKEILRFIIQNRLG